MHPFQIAAEDKDLVCLQFSNLCGGVLRPLNASIFSCLFHLRERSYKKNWKFRFLAGILSKKF